MNLMLSAHIAAAGESQTCMEEETESQKLTLALEASKYCDEF